MAAMVAAAAVSLIGCGQTQSASSPNYFPHENSYRWEYKSKLYVGTIENFSINETDYINGTTTLPSGLTVINFIISDEASSPNTFYYYVDDTGVYRYGNAAHPTTEAYQILAFPLEVGKVWTRGGSEPMTCTAISIEDVTVPAGTFRAMKVMVGDSSYYEWYTDGVGLVKTLVNLVVATYEAGTGRIITAEGVYNEELTSKNF
jgi:hypothetical protein